MSDNQQIIQKLKVLASQAQLFCDQEAETADSSPLLPLVAISPTVNRPIFVNRRLGKQPEWIDLGGNLLDVESVPELIEALVQDAIEIAIR